ncbi:Transcription initiation factor TFIID subunit 5 [Halotydeus destructor]|nr:Transcription initiation factor TFIID subunit 5 [Halotydeus destructor]
MFEHLESDMHEDSKLLNGNLKQEEDEATIRQINKTKVYYGLLKEPDINISIPDDDGDDGGENAGDGEKPKKKKSKKDALLSKKGRNDPNAPQLTRIPIPELRDSEKLDKIAALREASRRKKLGHDSLPSICFYTLLNAHYRQSSAICSEISEDSSLLAVGFSDSTVRVWALNPNNRLKSMKPVQDLELIDKEAEDVLYRMMDDKNTADMKVLRGHNGPVYAVSFSPDRNLLLSCSEDSTVRLWSLQTWTNLCVYKGHCFPIWDVKFSPHGYYFASAAHDRTARLWATDAHQPLRIFVGHVSDVDVVQFHPNSNYIATASTDCIVRLWDNSNGQCVRYLQGHRAKISALAFSAEGRYLASAGLDKSIMFWDLARASLVARLTGHHDAIYSLAFSRDGAILASGGADDCINLWDVRRLVDEFGQDGMSASRSLTQTQVENLLLGNYKTKCTNILNLHFTRKNLLLATGMFH